MFEYWVDANHLTFLKLPLHNLIQLIRRLFALRNAVQIVEGFVAEDLDYVTVQAEAPLRNMIDYFGHSRIIGT